MKLALLLIMLMLTSACAVGSDSDISLYEPPDPDPPTPAPECESPLRMCQRDCIDTRSDRNHCGGCGMPCPGSQSCINGDCVLDCGPNTIVCDDQCAPCPLGPASQTYACEDSACVVTSCGQGAYQMCGGVCAYCAHGPASSGCEGTSCIVSSCPPGRKQCNGICAPCPGLANSYDVCDGSECIPQCHPGHLYCDGVCTPCPQAPGTGSYTCQGGQCQAGSCRDGFIECDDGCCYNPPDVAVVVSDVHSPDLAVDRLGRPILAYGDQGLRLAFWDGQRWAAQLIDDTIAGASAWPAVAVDAQLRVHIVYRDHATNHLKYAVVDASDIEIQDVETESPVHLAPGLAVDAAGTPHISYVSGQTLYYATRNAAQWSRQTIASNVQDGLHAIALDPMQSPAVAYYDQNERIHLVRAIDQGAASVDVAVGQVRGPALSLALGASDAYILFSRVSSEDDHFAHLILLQVQGTTSMEEVLEEQTLAGISSPSSHALALDSTGSPHLVHRTVTGEGNGSLVYMREQAGSWQPTQIDAGLSYGHFARLVIADERMHIIHQEESPFSRHVFYYRLSP